MTSLPCLPAIICRYGLMLLLLASPTAVTASQSEAGSDDTFAKLSLNASATTDQTQSSSSGWFLQTMIAGASESDFGPALAFYYERPDQRTSIASISAGRQVGTTLLGWPAEVVLYGGLQYYNERGFQPDVTGGTVYIKAYQTFRVGKRQLPLRIGLGEGLSYASRIPIVEVEDFLPDTSAKLTNYLEWTLQTSVNHLLGRGGRRFSAGIRDIHIGYSVFHRSTVFGLFASKGGGVNYMGLSVELVLD